MARHAIKLNLRLLAGAVLVDLQLSPFGWILMSTQLWNECVVSCDIPHVRHQEEVICCRRLAGLSNSLASSDLFGFD